MMNTGQPVEIAQSIFSEQEARALRTLRNRYRQDHDLLSPRELARLRFLRWLVSTGRLAV